MLSTVAAEGVKLQVIGIALCAVYVTYLTCRWVRSLDPSRCGTHGNPALCLQCVACVVTAISCVHMQCMAMR